MAERCYRHCVLGGGELAQVVDAEAFFDIGDFIDHPLKAGLAEPRITMQWSSFRATVNTCRRRNHRANAVQIHGHTHGVPTDSDTIA